MSKPIDKKTRDMFRRHFPREMAAMERQERCERIENYCLGLSRMMLIVGFTFYGFAVFAH